MLPSPNDIEQCLLHSIPPQGLDGEILRTVLLASPAGEQEAFAVVSRRGGRCVTAHGFDVLLVSLETPMGAALHISRPGDDLPLGRVLSVDNSPTESAAAQRQAEADRQAESVRRREANAAEARLLATAQAAARRQEQEAFERRAAMHFERLNNKSGSKLPCKGTQLEWVFVKGGDPTDD